MEFREQCSEIAQTELWRLLEEKRAMTMLFLPLSGMSALGASCYGVGQGEIEAGSRAV